MYSADATFSQIVSWAGHEVKNCSNQFLMLREHGQVFSLHRERGIDRDVDIQFVIKKLHAWSYLYVNRIEHQDVGRKTIVLFASRQP